MTIRVSEKQKKITVRNAADIAPVLHDVLKRKRELRRHYEFVWLVGLNRNRKIEFIEVTAQGRFNITNKSPAEIFFRAIRKRATEIVLVQYNPRGNLMPLPEDRDTAIKMVKAGAILGIGVMDYMIISETGYLSFVEKDVVDVLPVETRKPVKMEQPKEAMTKAKQAPREQLKENVPGLKQSNKEQVKDAAVKMARRKTGERFK